jgi:hypothetical protein
MGLGQQTKPSGKHQGRWLGQWFGAILALLLTPDPVGAAGILRVDCSSVESTQFGDAQRMFIVSGQCPKTVDLSRGQIAGNLEFRDVQGLSTLDLSDATINGSLTMIGVTLDSLVLSGSQVSGEVYIAERSGSYEWIDNIAGEKCECQQEYGHTYFQDINADSLSARAFTMHGVGAEKFSMRRAQITGLVTLSRARFGEQVSFHYLRALGLDLNSAIFPGEIEAAQIQLEGNLTLECSEVGKRLSFWGSRLGGQLHLEGTRFSSTAEVRGFLSEMQQLTLGAAVGSVELFRLERSKIRILRLTDMEKCLRGPTIKKLLTEGLEFEWLQGDLDERFAKDFFTKGQTHDPTLYRRLADTYSAHGQHNAADKALIYHSAWLGRIRWLGSSVLGLSLVAALWLTPVVLWSFRAWPAQAGFIDRAVLAADLLLPDLVALGARERYQEELNQISGVASLLLASYRLLGWLIISVMIYVIIERASY